MQVLVTVRNYDNNYGDVTYFDTFNGEEHFVGRWYMPNLVEHKSSLTEEPKVELKLPVHKIIELKNAGFNTEDILALYKNGAV